jgi:hypothetical protein
MMASSAIVCSYVPKQPKQFLIQHWVATHLTTALFVA